MSTGHIVELAHPLTLAEARVSSWWRECDAYFIGGQEQFPVPKRDYPNLDETEVWNKDRFPDGYWITKYRLP